MNASREATLRLVPVAAATWATAAAAILLPAAAAGLALVLWATALTTAAIVVWRIRRSPRPRRAPTARRGEPLTACPQPAVDRLARLLVILVLAVAASAAAATHVALAQPARSVAESLALEGGRAIEVRAEVVGKVERRADGALAFDAVATRLTTGVHSTDTRVEVVVRVEPGEVAGTEQLDVGARVVARGTAQPGRAGERAVIVLWASRGVDVLRGPTGIAAATARLRQGLVDAVEGLPGVGAGLVPGLAVGDTSAVTPALDAAMKESSLSHLTAVSGANCALVVGIAFAVAAAIGAPRGVRVGAGLAVLVGFVALVTPEPSVVRAGAMAAIAMTALLLGREGAGMATLSLAVAVLLIADPWLAASLGFALSAAATGSLLLLTRPLAAGLSRVMPRALALALAVPLAAQLACGPLLILIAPQIPVYGVLANLLAGPAAPAATVLGLAACLAAPVPWLQSGLAAIAWVPASWIAATATTVSTLPADLLPWIEGWPGAAALAVLGAAIGVLIAVARTVDRRRRVVRAISGVLVGVIAGVSLGTGALASIAGRWTVPDAWTVLACDVGQGDAVLLRSADAVALIDTGPEPERLSACLARTGIQSVDLLVLTHFDLDHVGGVEAVMGHVDTVLHGPPDPEGEALIDRLTAGGARAVAASAGLTGALGDARWRVLWPIAESRAFPAGNDASVVLDVRGGGIPPLLMLGDLSASPQRAIEASGALAPPYAIVKVAHHGSADQEPALYVAADPATALITVGADNDYGHPRDEILEVLSATGSRIARTDTDGLVALWQSGATLSLWRERGR